MSTHVNTAPVTRSPPSYVCKTNQAGELFRDAVTGRETGRAAELRGAREEHRRRQDSATQQEAESEIADALAARQQGCVGRGVKLSPTLVDTLHQVDRTHQAKSWLAVRSGGGVLSANGGGMVDMFGSIHASRFMQRSCQKQNNAPQNRQIK